MTINCVLLLLSEGPNFVMFSLDLKIGIFIERIQWITEKC